MRQSTEQLLEESIYPSLADFLRTGGTLEIGEDPSIGSFARIRKGNWTVSVDAKYRDFPDVLKVMDASAKNMLSRSSALDGE